MSRRGWLLFAAMCLIWGIPYMLIKVALTSVSPAFLVFSRTGIAALVLLPVVLLRRGSLPPRTAWLPLLAFACIEIAGPWWLLNDAERRMTSSLAGLMLATVPLIGSLVLRALGDRSALSGKRLAGLLVGMAGVAAVVGFDLGAGVTSALGVVEVLLVALGYAVAPIIASRRLSEVNTLMVIALSLTGVALAYSPAAVLSHPPSLPRPEVLAAVLTLALVCTAGAFVIFFALIAEAGPVRATVITFVNPAVAVLLGMGLLKEPLTLGIVLGFPLVIAGSWLSTRQTRTESRPPLVPVQERLAD